MAMSSPDLSKLLLDNILPLVFQSPDEASIQLKKLCDQIATHITDHISSKLEAIIPTATYLTAVTQTTPAPAAGVLNISPTSLVIK